MSRAWTVFWTHFKNIPTIQWGRGLNSLTPGYASANVQCSGGHSDSGGMNGLAGDV